MKKECVAEKFRKGFDCSQVVLEHYAGELEMTPEAADRAAAAFGGGMGMGETCGAVIGAMIALGMKYGHYREDKMEQKDVMNAKRAEFLGAFLEKYPSCSCKELLKYDISKPEELEKILEEGLLFDFCPQVVVDVTEILDKMMYCNI